MPTPTYDLIEEKVLGSAQASVTFSSIPGTYKDLVLEIMCGATTGTPVIYFRLNGDTATNYSHTHLGGNGTAAQSGRGSNESYGWGGMSLAGTSNDLSTVSTWNFMQYTSANVNKTVLCRNGAAGREADTSVTLWRKTPEAITSIACTLSNSTTFLSGSTFRLWGVSG